MTTFQVSPALRIGHTAQEILHAPEFSATVLAVVTNAVYLTTRDDEILWLAQPQLPAHPRALFASFDSSNLWVGMNANVTNEHLTMGDVAIDLRDADVWQPPTIAHAAPLDTVKERTREAKFVLTLSRETIGDEAITRVVGEISRSARNDSLNYRNSQFATLASHASVGVRNMIGLGAGLTPAGDDFVGGLLFAAHHLQKTYPGISAWDAPSIDELIEYARTQTNKISFAILRDLAQGQGPEPLHDFIDALLNKENIDDLQSRITRLIAIGHSTGRAMLNGVITGIEIFEG